MAVMRKLDTLVADFPDTNTLTEQNEICQTYSSEIIHRRPQAEGGQHLTEGTGKADDNLTE